MAFKYAHAGVYYCDTTDCRSKQFSESGELPPGWTEVGTHGIEPLTVVLHRCDACSEKVLADLKKSL